MGRLKPGATYIYERVDGIVYAREVGQHPSERFVIGYESGADYDPFKLANDDKMWTEIRLAAKSNPALQEALDRVKVLYELSKPNE